MRHFQASSPACIIRTTACRHERALKTSLPATELNPATPTNDVTSDVVARARAATDISPALLSLKPKHKSVAKFYAALKQFDRLGVKHEGAVAAAFEDLLEHCARQVGRTLIPKYTLKRKGAKPIIPDAAVVDSLSSVLTYGFWEAKDTDDDLEEEIKAKFKAGYPSENILFQEPRRAILYQNGTELVDADLADPSQLVHLLDLFFAWRPPAFAVWEHAVEEFKLRVPELGKSLAKLIKRERQTNAKYRTAFATFVQVCRTSLNPNLSQDAVEEMVIQHLLTERIFRKVFDIADFMQRNVIAQEIEAVIDALTSRNFSRDTFTASLEHFYVAIEQAAETIADFTEKQKFLNTAYERFFQGFSVKAADTHGIVYTPQPLVDFMVASVEHVLARDFRTSLGNENVHILDPFTGTGNFVVNIMRRIPRTALPAKFKDELFCNEVMLLPYYVASMNIESRVLGGDGHVRSVSRRLPSGYVRNCRRRARGARHFQRGKHRADRPPEASSDQSHHRESALQRWPGQRERQQQESQIRDNRPTR